MNESIAKTISQLAKTQKARFVSLTYRAKKSGELARHTLLLGASYEKAKQRDLQRLLILSSRLDGIKKIACEELIESMRKPAGENDAYTCAGVYEETDIRGLKVHKETGVLHLMGYSIKKEVLEKGEYPNVKSNEKTIAKNELKNLPKMRTGKIRQFSLSLENIKSITTNGKTIEII